MRILETQPTIPEPERFWTIQRESTWGSGLGGASKSENPQLGRVWRFWETTSSGLV